ncbi:MAG: hypothetical protein OEZ65_16370 [Gemmatimonadota bacterium]|nr:hypothetical protein [Gemmatimonadota bacterium]
MSERGGRSWLQRAIEEVPILVVGILIAFGLQAWWEGQRSSGEEQRTLIAVQGELRQNAEGLRTYIGWHERVARCAEALLSAVGDGSPPQRVEVHDSLLLAVLVSPTFDASTTATEAALTSRAGSQVVWDALSRWREAVVDAAGEERRSREFTDERLSGFLSPRVPLPDAELSIGWLFGTSASPIEGITAIDTSPELRFLVSTRLKYAQLAALELHEAMTALEAAEGSLAAELR